MYTEIKPALTQHARPQNPQKLFRDGGGGSRSKIVTFFKSLCYRGFVQVFLRKPIPSTQNRPPSARQRNAI